ncbi:MAG: glycoside hydrolase family 97 protein [Marinilabiliaceae bacterium]|jgi:alpha-glucosidase|nr:glycoside hydrolase family 97 protein [Marinilabiliaceae bacterium]
MKIKSILSILIVLVSSSALYAQDYNYYSPDSKLELVINNDGGFSWMLKYNGKQVILPSYMELEFATRTIPGDDYRIKDFVPRMVDRTYHPLVPHKDSEIRDRHNDLTVEFRSGFSIQFRIFNDGIAYRFNTAFKENMIVINERSQFNFLPGSKIWYPLEEGFMSHNERTYLECSLDTINNRHLASLPLLVQSEGINLLLSESNLESYPGMWVRGAGNGSLLSVFPKYPSEEKLFGDRNMRVIETTDFIAETEGKRSYPWRLLLISPDDAGLIESNITWLLADTCRLENTDWIKPGKVAWDWWNANNIYSVDFKSGVNTETYKYYIDFASENKIEYIILDEGWYKLGDLLDVSEGMDMEELFAYAKSKNVGIILWVVWETLDRQLDRALAQFQAWGAKGIKVDFMQRDDQKMVEYYEKIARKAADYQLLVDFHGSYKPAGLRRTYPNVMTREGVKGLEHNKWSRDITPDHDLTIPFIRMVAGPMDYTPGAMINLERQNFNPMFTRPASQGTRVHQMALYIAYESPLQMMADNPVNYRKEQECTDFIAAVPVTWDETVVLEAKVGDYLVIARRKGDIWYLGGLSDSEARSFDIDISALGNGDYNAVIFMDGINAGRYASDYKRIEKTISSSEILTMEMAPGGGWAARLTKK